MPAPIELHERVRKSGVKVGTASTGRGNGHGAEPEALPEEAMQQLYGVRNASEVFDETLETEETKETKETSEYLETKGNFEETKKKLRGNLETGSNLGTNCKRNVHQDVLDWLETCDGEFSLKEIAAEFGALAGSLLYNNIKLVVFKIQKKNIIERVGNRRGYYRRVEETLEEMNWWDCSNEESPLVLPLDIGRLCKIMPKSIIVIAGEQNSSKSAIALNIAKDNCETFETHFFNSEMSSEELRERIMRFDDIDPDHFRKVHFYSRSENFHDVIRPDGLNIIDFLEVHDDFWRVGGWIRAIFDKLNQGVCVINLQKAPGRDWGRGGTGTLEKARLYLAVSTKFQDGKPTNEIKIVKAKLYRDLEHNPNGMTREFRVYGGAKLLAMTGWQHARRK